MFSTIVFCYSVVPAMRAIFEQFYAVHCKTFFSICDETLKALPLKVLTQFKKTPKYIPIIMATERIITLVTLEN